MAEKEYIEREKILQHLSDQIEAFGNLNEDDFPVSYGGLLSMKYAHSVVITAPKADVVEVVHGEWFLLDECSNEGVYCSVCTKKVYRTEYANQKLKSNYCPNCGAKMNGERKEK